MGSLKKGTMVRKGADKELIPMKKKSTEQASFEAWRETAQVDAETVAKAREFAKAQGWQNPDDDVVAHIVHAMTTAPLAESSDEATE